MNSEDDLVLDREFLESVADNLKDSKSDQSRVDRLRTRVMQRIDEDDRPSLFDTIRSTEGEWIKILPKIEKKTLKIDASSGAESYLLRMQAGATAPNHLHSADELCYVIEGDISFGELHLEAGDYHYAHKGSEHRDVRTTTGALLFLQSGGAG